MSMELNSGQEAPKTEKIERQTKQKKLIKSIFVDTGRPLSAAEVHQMSVSIQQNLGIATVYRVVKSLLEDGVLSEVFLPQQDTVRYEIKNHAPHFHFYCQKCDRMFPVKGSVPNLEKYAPPGFVATNNYVLLQGHCTECDKNPKTFR